MSDDLTQIDPALFAQCYEELVNAPHQSICVWQGIDGNISSVSWNVRWRDHSASGRADSAEKAQRMIDEALAEWRRG